MDLEAVEALSQRVQQNLGEVGSNQVSRVVNQGYERVVAVNRSLEQYEGLNRVLSNLPIELKTQVRAAIDHSLDHDALMPKRLAILDAIIDSAASRQLNLGRVLERNQITLNQLPDILSDSVIISLIDFMASSPERYKFQLGVLLSQIPFNQLSEPLAQKLQPVLTNLEFQIKVGNEQWWLCGEAEPRFLRCIQSGALVLVNDALLVKFEGKFTALCVKNMRMPNGQTFIEGNMYSPVGSELKKLIQSNFDNGNAKPNLQSGEWAMIRGLNNDSNSGLSAAEILNQAKQYAANMPDQLPDTIGGIPRRQFRSSRPEEIHG
jgi:hypothetical protein